LSHAIQVFFLNIAILGCFNLIQEEIMQISKTEHLYTCEDIGKTNNEYSRDLKRHCKGMNFVPKSQDILCCWFKEKIWCCQYVEQLGASSGCSVEW